MTRNNCPRCGNEFDDDEARGLCPACLLKQAMETPGTAARDCSRCGSPLPQDAHFCARCGAPAAATETSASGDPLEKALETKLGNQYRIVRLLGRGGMGAVYLARDLALDREVAIKVVKTEAAGGAAFERFRREARTAAKLSHPNIVPLHAFGEIEGQPYFVMGYVRGESLAERLRRQGRLAEDEARRILAEIADALDHAHRQGIVHRDVKPENILLDDESGRALLTDFGVAKAPGHGETMTRHGSVIGTPHYMSPEQASGHAGLDARSDIYSLGVMGYAMLAGRLPFDGTTAAEVLTKHITQAPPPLRSFNATVSDSTVQALERCLAKDPAARWADARSLKLALGAVEEGQLPDALEAVEGQGVLGLVIGVLLLIIIRLTNPPAAIYAVNVGVIAFIYLIVGVRLRMEGFGFVQSQQAIWTEPVWWPFWYPRSLRRRRNVWERLPLSARRVRASGLALIVIFAALLFGPFPNAFRNPGAFALKIGAFFAVILIWDGMILFARRDLKKRGVPGPDVHRVMLSIPPSRSSFWARPHIAAILAPAAQGDDAHGFKSPHEQLQSILRHGNELTGPLRPLGAQAAVAARQLVASIEQVERQIGELARNVEPGEEERLRDKIDALASDEVAPMRALLAQQLELIRGLSQRIESAKETRNRRLEMLRTLALHVASLRARMPETPSHIDSLSDSVRALCDEIGAQATPMSANATTAELPTVNRSAGGATST